MAVYKYTEPIEMPRGSHYGSSYILMPSRKIGRIVTLFSNLEYENVLTLEMDPEVEYYCEQPLKTEVMVSGQKHETIFDVYVAYRDGREEFQEVKYAEELERGNPAGKRSRDQVACQQLWCLQNNMAYTVRTDKEIEKGDLYIRNLEYLFGKVRRFKTPDKDADRYIREYLKNLKRATVGLLDSSGRFANGKTVDYLAYLYYKGFITFADMEDDIISNKTEVICLGN